ncbi:MAG: hypothetical protein MJZ56_03770 [Bacteroidales bacterium]|nr:hypothetical protein [Bacteroidales bacterium]
MKKTFLILAAMLCCIMLNAQQPTGDGSQANPYLLTNYADLQWFAAQVNGGQNGICAKLTADINAATSVETINAIKEQALAAIASAMVVYNSALGEMGEPCEDCPSVEVTKGTKTVKLYNPESVKFKKE